MGDEYHAAQASARELMLTTPAADLGFADHGATPWGVAIDIGFDEETAATVISLADGTTSLYTTTGGGIIGGGEHGLVADASRFLVETAVEFVNYMRPRDDVDLPGTGNVTMWLRIGDQRLGVTVSEAELVTGASPLAPFYATGHSVITQLRLLDDSRG